MAGKKGMKHARPKTQEERDAYALNKIEYIIDSIGDEYVKCPACQSKHKPLMPLTAVGATLLKARYDKLRATRTESTITHKTTFVDALQRVQKEAEKPARTATQTQTEHTPHVTH